MVRVSLPALVRVAGFCLAAAGLAACQDAYVPKDIRPVDKKLVNRMQVLGMRETSPVFVRIFKEESEFEVWKQQSNGKYALLKTYDICTWSGVLGPKLKEGDRQAPEGFYTVTPSQMNPKSNYYLAFNIGFPNAFDRAHNRTGSHLMVHGACSSAGCYSMTDEAAGEIFALARDAFKGGQRSFQIQAFPFRMTPQNMARHRDDPNMPFWQNLKLGYDHFEVTHVPPKVDVCEKRYVFNAEAGRAKFVATSSCPAYQVPDSIETAVRSKQAADEKAYASAVAKIGAKDQALAEQKQKVAVEQAAQAEEAAEPPLLSRIFGRDKNNGTPANATPTPAGEPVTATGSIAPPSAPTPTTESAPAPARPKAAPADAAAAGDSSDAEAEGSSDSSVGRVVNREFLWPDDTPVIAGGAAIVPPTLTPPAGAN